MQNNKNNNSVKNNFLITIFTPVYNGEKTINRVFTSLKASVYRNFQWIIINDGSKDNSDEVIRNYIENTDWDITYENWSENKGKHIAWNHAAKIAKGEIFITLDCDDSFIPEALHFFNEKWNEYYKDKSVYGIDTLCIDPTSGDICGTKFPYDGIKSTYDELYNIHKVRGDKWNSYRTEYIKNTPFPEIKAHYYTECYLLYSLGEKYKLIGFNKVLRHYYQEPFSIMHNKTTNINDLYMIVHYQRWNLRRHGFHLLNANFREFCRCTLELCRTYITYKIMKILKIHCFQKS